MRHHLLCRTSTLIFSVNLDIVRPDLCIPIKTTNSIFRKTRIPSRHQFLEILRQLLLHEFLVDHSFSYRLPLRTIPAICLIRQIILQSPCPLPRPLFPSYRLPIILHGQRIMLGHRRHPAKTPHFAREPRQLSMLHHAVDFTFQHQQSILCYCVSEHDANQIVLCDVFLKAIASKTFLQTLSNAHGTSEQATGCTLFLSRSKSVHVAYIVHHQNLVVHDDLARTSIPNDRLVQRTAVARVLLSRCLLCTTTKVLDNFIVPITLSLQFRSRTPACIFQRSIRLGLPILSFAPTVTEPLSELVFPALRLRRLVSLLHTRSPDPPRHPRSAAPIRKTMSVQVTSTGACLKTTHAPVRKLHRMLNHAGHYHLHVQLSAKHNLMRNQIRAIPCKSLAHPLVAIDPYVQSIQRMTTIDVQTMHVVHCIVLTVLSPPNSSSPAQANTISHRVGLRCAERRPLLLHRRTTVHPRRQP